MEGAVSLGLAILIVLYYAFFHTPKKKNIVYTSESEQNYRNEFAKEQTMIVDKILKKSPSEFWNGKSESEYRWILGLNLSEDPDEYVKNNVQPEPSGIPNYFDSIKSNPYSGNIREYELGVKIANNEPVC